MLKAVAFDLWQTLLLDTPEGLRQARAERVRGMREALAGEGIAVEAGAVALAYDAVGGRLEEVWGTQRDVGSRGQVRMLLGCLGLDGVVPARGRLMDALDAAYCLPILLSLPVPNAGALHALRTLHAHGLTLGLICNTGRTPGKMLRIVLSRLDMAPYLRVLTFSDEVSLRKPHPEIFHRTLAALGVAATEAAHVGDDATTDVAGARAVGMRPIHLRHPSSVSQVSDGVEVITNLHALPAVLLPTSD